MDNFTIKLLDKPIDWKSGGLNECLNQESYTRLNWDEIDNLYLECQLQDQASNVTNVINESYVSELNIKMHQLIRTNRQSSASDVIDSDVTQEINDENKKQINELPQRPVLKRANTSYRSNNKSFTELIREKEKFKRYRNNRKSARTLSMVYLKRSLITPKLLNPSKESKKHVSINYFNSDYSKQFKIDKEMLVCELIVLAINEYKKTQEFDQSLLKYPNFTLAYQLISYDDNCDFSAFSSKVNSFEQKKLNSVQQYQYIADVNQSIQDRRIEFDLATRITFSHFTLMVNEINQYGLDLEIVETTQQYYPNLIILLIEDEKNQTLYNIRCDPTGNVDSIHEELSKKASFKFQKNEFYFTLKYSCVNFIQTEPLPQELPIRLLPIHWLVITFKFDKNAIASSGSLNFRDLQIQSEGQLSQKKSQNFYILETKEKPEMFHQMYNYEEFQLLKIENDGCINQISIGIDYFDIYYYYTGQKNRKCTIGSLAKSFVKMLLKDAYSGQSKDYKRIPMTSVLQILEKKSQNIFEVRYRKQDSNCKRKIFTIPETQGSNNNEIQNQFKLSFTSAIKKLLFIIDKRKNNFTID